MATVEKKVLQKRVLVDLRTVGVETRAGLRPAAVDDYAAVLRGGGSLPPGVVFVDADGTNWLGSGHHRKAAHEKAGIPRMLCEIRRGTRWDAIRHGIESNLAWQGERITLVDKRHNVKRVLKEQPGMSDRAIAELCGVSPTTVGKHRGENDCPVGQSSQRVGQDGRVYNTGRQPASVPPVPDAAEQVDAAPGAVAAEGCSCGSPWESDGNGGRYCPACQLNHPQTPSQPMGAPVVEAAEAKPTLEDDFLTPVVCGPVAKPQDGAKLYEEVTRQLGHTHKLVGKLGDIWPGPHYQFTSRALDKAGECLMAWAAWENDEHNPPVDEQCPNLEGCDEAGVPG